MKKRLDVEHGQQVNLRMGPHGEAFITLEVLNESKGKTGVVEFLIDTGFNGYLQLDKNIIDLLELVVTEKAFATGFDRVVKEVGILTTKVKLLSLEITNCPIQTIDHGNCLIGTKLLQELGYMVVVDYKNSIISLSTDSLFREKLHLLLDNHNSVEVEGGE